ncbi:dihydrofolate reductase [Methylobacter sp.]
MSLTLIAAVAKNSVIGNSKMRKMPWYVPEELKFFKENTMGKVLVMGRKTAEETGKLRARDCIVLSKDPAYKLHGFITMTIEQLLAVNAYDFDKQYAICGGAEIYKELMPYCSMAMISYMDFDAPGDVLMPALDRTVWRRAQSVEMNKFTAVSYVNTDCKTYSKIISKH